MNDSRFIWMQHFSTDRSRITIIIPKETTASGLLALKELWKDKMYPTVVEAEQCCYPFTPLSENDIEKLECDTIVYLIQSRESSKAIKRKLISKSQHAIAEYSVFPNWKNPRWFIPEWRSLLPGCMSRMIQPSTLIARTAVIVLRVLKAIQRPHLVFPCRLIVAYKNKKPDRSIINFFQNQKDRITTGVIYAGSYGPLQKFTVELFRDNESPFGYAKFGHNEYTKQAILNEQTILKRLAKLSLKRMKTPILMQIKHPEILDKQILTVETLEGGNPINRVTDPLIHGLVELYIATEKNDGISLKSYITNQSKSLIEIDCTCLHGDYNKIRDNVVVILEGLLSHTSESIMLPLALSHGDFTRWNVRADKKTIYVIDWEEAAMRPPGHDLLYFLLAEYILAAQNTPEKCAKLINQEIMHGLLVRFLTMINGKDKTNARQLGILFFVSTIISTVWHAERHIKMGYPVKKNLFEIINMAYLSVQHLVGDSNFD